MPREFGRHVTPNERRQTPVRVANNPRDISLEDAKASDANVLMAQYRKNGTLPAVKMHQPLEGDFTGPRDLQTAIEQVQIAEDRFAELPADVRTAADNDPVKFLEMFEDESQRALLESAGLITPKPEEPVPEPSPPTPPAPEGAPPAPTPPTPPTPPDAT